MDLTKSELYDKVYFESERDTASVSAKQVVPIVFELIRPRSVVDVGCGTGAWLAQFRQSGAEDILGIDASWIRKDMLLIPEEEFLERDLRKPISIDRKFDLVVSLEVAEHLPSEAAETLVTSLVSLGPVVLFSAAIPHQGGVNHLNEQWPGYWSVLFKAHGYDLVDCLRGKIWQDTRISYVYRQNILIFIERERLKEFPALQLESERKGPLNLVHPDLWNGYVSAIRSGRGVPARIVIRSLPYIPAKIARYILRKLG